MKEGKKIIQFLMSNVKYLLTLKVNTKRKLTCKNYVKSYKQNIKNIIFN